MSSRIHPRACTIPKIRQETKDSGVSDRQAAKVFNVTRAAAAKWLQREPFRAADQRSSLHAEEVTCLETGFRVPGQVFRSQDPALRRGALLHSRLYHRTGYSTSAVISVFTAAMGVAIHAMRAQFGVALTAMIEPVNLAV